MEPPVSVPGASKVERAAIAAADPPDDPPGVRAFPLRGPSLAVHGLITAPKALVSLAEPIANSSQLILPSMTAPSCHRFSVTVDSYGGTNPFRMAEDAVVSTPLVQNISLTPIGIPSSNPPVPSASRASLAFAISMAFSDVRKT